MTGSLYEYSVTLSLITVRWGG